MKNTNKAIESTDFHAQFLPERRLIGERKFGIEKRQRRIRIESKRNRKLGRRRRDNCRVTGGCFKKIGSPASRTQEEGVEGGREVEVMNGDECALALPFFIWAAFSLSGHLHYTGNSSRPTRSLSACFHCSRMWILDGENSSYVVGSSVWESVIGRGRLISAGTHVGLKVPDE
ncbi:hypothetical protein TIFTF001_018206 [Ficus carica]|uniref:Uncharacterized protein n=1 Tax=Ficus carica TaxID=3494 RepID=A0AA88AC17_FICCA|nr:hypothetical protein TIFTF001_018206 [Ficus carica]